MNTRYILSLLTIILLASNVANAQNIMDRKYALHTDGNVTKSISVAVTIDNKLQITYGKHQIVVNEVTEFDVDSSYVFDKRFLVLRYTDRVGSGIAERHTIVVNILQDTLQVPMHILQHYIASLNGDTQEHYSAKLSFTKLKNGMYTANIMLEHYHKDSSAFGSGFFCKRYTTSLDYSTDNHVFMSRMLQIKESREMYDPELDRYVKDNTLTGRYPYFSLCGIYYTCAANGWVYITKSQVVKMSYFKRL